MFILFDAECAKCGRPFKVEADCAAGVPAGEYRYACPRCHTAATFRGEQAAVTEVTTGWAVRATAAGAPV